MSVKIEILDYVYKSIQGEQINIDGSFNNAGSWTVTPAGTWTISGGNAQKIINTSAGYLRQSMTFQEGQKYRIKYKVSGRTNGNFILANHLAGGANGFNTNTNGEFIYEWIQGSNNLDKLSLYGSSSFDGYIEYARVYLLSDIDWDNSIVGELDITDHSEFPLAMTFQISDFKNLTSTSGDYSKTFKIPATKNNNNLLKHLYIPNLINENKVTNKKSCRILFNGLYSLVGLIQVDGVGGYGETPSYYSCVFFGRNLSWASGLEDTYMNELKWGTYGEGLKYNKTDIMATWQHLDCDNSSNSPIVYPIVSYGDYNELGTERTIQLLDTATDAGGGSGDGYVGFNNAGVSAERPYGTPPPVADWRPSVFVKPTLEKIFSQLGENGGGGYKINSAFMETDMFKKLVWLLPNFKYNNPDDRVLDYSVRSNFNSNGVSMSTDAYDGSSTPYTVTEDGILEAFFGNVRRVDENKFYSGTGRIDLPLDASRLTVTLDGNNYVDPVNNYITIGDYGYYKISLNGMQGRLAMAWKGGNDTESITNVNICINLEVQTDGQSSWNIIDRCDSTQLPHQITDTNLTWTNFKYSLVTDWQNLSSINFQSYYLNKNDKIRLTTGYRINAAGDGSQQFVTKTFIRSSNNSNFNIELSPYYAAYGQTYNLEDVISSDYKQIDFVKGIAHAFNLHMTTNESTRTVNIEPFDSFYKPYGDAIDWTYKLDRGNEISDKWLESDLKRSLVFKYKSDNKDLKVKRRGEDWFEGIQDEYPYREELPSTFKKGDSTFENPFFAGTYNGKDQDTVEFTPIDTAFSAILWDGIYNTTDLARPAKGYNFLPRLLYWNKYSPTGMPSPYSTFGLKKYAAVQTWSSSVKYLNPNADHAAQSSILSNIYPQATMYNRNNITSPNLAYGNVWVDDYDDATETYAATQASKGLFDTYYKNMIEGLKRSPRLRTISVSLNITDIINLDFTKLIYIDGVYWRLNRIVDYLPNKNQSTKVELIEWFQIGIFAASAPMFGGGGLGGGTWTADGGILDEGNIWG